MEHLRAALLLTRFLRSTDRLPGEPVALPAAGGSIEALLYEPERAARATILAVHGLNTRAQYDPRLVSVARALQGAGYRVVCPRIGGLSELRVEVSAVERITLAARALLDHERLGAPSIGIFSASFAAGQCLVAAAQQDIAQRISGMLLIGAFVDAAALIEHVLTVQDGDDYGRLIAIRGMLHSELSQRLLRAIEAYLSDQSSGAAVASLPDALAALAPEEQARFAALVSDPLVGKALAHHIVRTRAFYVERLSALPALPGLRAAVTLVHGRRDKVIPASQSVRLATLLRCQGARVRLHISDLLSHGDVEVVWRERGLALLSEIPSLVDAVAFWLRSLDPRSVWRER